MEKEAEAQQRQVPWCEVRVARCDLAVLVLRLAPLGPSRRLHFGVPNGVEVDWIGVVLGFPLDRSLQNGVVKTVAQMGLRRDKKRRGDGKGKASLSLAHEHFTSYH